jgi:hypothetical protein
MCVKWKTQRASLVDALFPSIDLLIYNIHMAQTPESINPAQDVEANEPITYQKGDEVVFISDPETIFTVVSFKSVSPGHQRLVGHHQKVILNDGIGSTEWISAALIKPVEAEEESTT